MKFWNIKIGLIEKTLLREPTMSFPENMNTNLEMQVVQSGLRVYKIPVGGSTYGLRTSARSGGFGA